MSHIKRFSTLAPYLRRLPSFLVVFPTPLLAVSIFEIPVSKLVPIPMFSKIPLQLPSFIALSNCLSNASHTFVGACDNKLVLGTRHPARIRNSSSLTKCQGWLCYSCKFSASLDNFKSFVMTSPVTLFWTATFLYCIFG